MTDKERFENIVSQIVNMYEENDIELEDKITELENEIEQTGMGEAFFFATKGDELAVDFIRNHIRYAYYAEYYDGFRAPFTVCAWNGTIDFLIELARKHGIIVNERGDTEVAAGHKIVKEVCEELEEAGD